MLVGVPKEIKDHEYRVGLVPSSVAELVHHGHTVLVERGAGVGAGLYDDDYRTAGGTLVDGPDRIFGEADLVVKVKEPLAAERRKLRRGQVLFTYLHLAPDLDADQGPDGERRDLHRLRDRDVAVGRPAAAHADVRSRGQARAAGRSELPREGARRPGHPARRRAGRAPAEVVILGGGVSGTHAATIALGMGANVTVVDRSAEVLRRLSAQFGSQRANDLLDARRARATRAACRPVDRGGAGARRRGAEADQPRRW